MPTAPRTADSRPARPLDDFDRGVKNRRACSAMPGSTSRSTTPTLQRRVPGLITRYAWHDIWGRPGLDPTTRRLLVLGMTMGMARWEEFELHCRAAIRGGVALATIKEALMQGAIYCGVPAANTAFKITLEILREEGLVPAPRPLSVTRRASRHHTFSQPQLAVSVQGEGTPIVLSHALGLDQRMWDAVAARLAPQHTVLRYDHRGHGGSAVPAGPYAMEDLLDDAARLIREWSAGPVVWIGLSMGGMVGQGSRSASRAGARPRHREQRVALSGRGTAALDRAHREGRAGRSRGDRRHGDRALLQRRLRASQPDIVAAYRRQLLQTDPAGYAAACPAVRDVDWLDRLASIRCPTLVIAGREDVGAPVALCGGDAAAHSGCGARRHRCAAHLSVVEQPAAFGRRSIGSGEG
jgi:3-oxoadipate enol-lactonase